REPVALPVSLRDVGRVLVPVPRARVAAIVVGRVARVERIADPANRQRLVHERAVSAVEGEVLAAVAPVVRLLGAAVAVRALVPAHSYQALARPTRIHLEGEFLVVLGDRERARMG